MRGSAGDVRTEDPWSSSKGATPRSSSVWAKRVSVEPSVEDSSPAFTVCAFCVACRCVTLRTSSVRDAPPSSDALRPSLGRGLASLGEEGTEPLREPLRQKPLTASAPSTLRLNRLERRSGAALEKNPCPWGCTASSSLPRLSWLLLSSPFLLPSPSSG